MLLTCLFLYVPKIYRYFPEERLRRCFLLWGVQLLCALSYWFFRMNVKACLRIHGHSKSAIRKGLQGRKMWRYREFRTAIRLLYPLNTVLVAALPTVFVLSITIGWITAVTPLIEWLVAAKSVCSAVALIVSGFYSRFEMLTERRKLDTTLLFSFFGYATFLVYCAVKIIS